MVASLTNAKGLKLALNSLSPFFNFQFKDFLVVCGICFGPVHRELLPTFTKQEPHGSTLLPQEGPVLFELSE